MLDKPECYYYVYSAMAQVTGGLIALVGIFIVYHLQVQRERIQDASNRLREALQYGDCNSIHIVRYKKLLEIAAELLATTQNMNVPASDVPKINRIRIERDNIKWHIDNLHHTVKRGAIIVFVTTLLFLWFIAGLFAHSFLLDQASYFWASLFAAFFVVMFLGHFLWVVLKEESNEYSLKE